MPVKTISLAMSCLWRKLCKTPSYINKGDYLVLLKLKSQSSPRLYFIDLIPELLVFVHGLKKKKFGEDPADEEKARERIKTIESGKSLSKFVDE